MYFKDQILRTFIYNYLGGELVLKYSNECP